ncbi:hypothetical protein CfE428DRAFT_0014 [Chthoniobacter flavus Ellin428]|uniref:Uncharacterized protein n=1 Tax=Chthoniobacter flavus Ellin428 TaxID=497964 RepID=B4CTL5_9BACT|nr:hypothetical protein CfE428DRAFT_0014 [Chthoniobacter flavus Ellin428]
MRSRAVPNISPPAKDGNAQERILPLRCYTEFARLNTAPPAC